MSNYLSSLDLAVSPSQVGWRLDKILANQPELSHLSRTRLQNLILSGHILVDGKRQKTGYRLKQGEEISITIPSPHQPNIVPMAVDFAVLFEDSDIIVVNKPPGLVVHPAPGHQSSTLVHGLLYYCGDLSGIGGELRPGIVHRLDKDTSGVLVVAKNDLAHQHLARQFQQRQVSKVYHALVAGHLPQKEGRLETLLGRHPIQRKKMAILKSGGRNAITRYRVLATVPLLSLVEVVIETGRTHQIRVHMAHLGCPIIADPIYGGKKTKIVAANRLCLHASHLQIVNPGTGKEMHFRAPLPADINQVLNDNGLLGILP